MSRRRRPTCRRRLTGAPPAPLTLGALDATGAFVPFTDGQDVTLVEGAQGGFHVWVVYAYAGAIGVEVTLARDAHRAVDGAIVLRTSAQVTTVAQSDPLPMFMCPSPVGLSVIDQPIDYALAMTDAEGNTLAAGSITLVPHCPEGAVDFCMRICTG